MCAAGCFLPGHAPVYEHESVIGRAANSSSVFLGPAGEPSRHIIRGKGALRNETFRERDGHGGVVAGDGVLRDAVEVFPSDGCAGGSLERPTKGVADGKSQQGSFEPGDYREVRTSIPCLMTSSGAANEIRKWVSFSEKTPPGMMRRFRSMARATNSWPVEPSGAAGKM